MFRVKLGLVRGKNLPAGLHAAEASCVSASALSALRGAIVRSVWSSEMPLANTPVVLNLLDGPVGVDPAFQIIWTRFRLMRRYLAHWPDEVPRIFRLPDFTAHGADGHGPVNLLLTAAAEIGLTWAGVRGVGFGLASFLLERFRGLSNISRALFLRPGSSKLVLSWRIGKGLGVRNSLMSEDLCKYLPLLSCGKEIKSC